LDPSKFHFHFRRRFLSTIHVPSKSELQMGLPQSGGRLFVLVFYGRDLTLSVKIYINPSKLGVSSVLKKFGEPIGKLVLLFGMWLAFLFAVDALPGENMRWLGAVSTPLWAVLVMMAIFERKSGWELGFRQTHGLSWFARGMLAGSLAMGVVFAATLLSRSVKVQTAEFFVRSHGEVTTAGIVKMAGSQLFFLLLFFLVAVAEEALARGYLQGLFTRRFGGTAGKAVSSLLFALLHGLNPGVWSQPLPMVTLVLAGWWLAEWRERSGGLWGPIGIHFAWNFVQGPILGFAVSGLEIPSLLRVTAQGPDVLSGGRFGAEGSLFAVLVLTGAIGWTRKMKNGGGTQAWRD
jgi:membrane protease YdiL (CAAX protease family)